MKPPTHPHTYHLSLGAIQGPLHCKHNQRPSPHFTTHLELYRDSPPQLTKPEIKTPHISPLSKNYTLIASPLPMKIEIPNLHKELHQKRALHCLHYQTLFPHPHPNLNHHNELLSDNFFTAKTTSPQWTQPEIIPKPHPSQGATQRELLNCLNYKKFLPHNHKKLRRHDLSSTYIKRDPPHFTSHKKVQRDNLSTTNTPK